MPIKFEVQSLDGMNAEIQKLYVKDGDVYRLDVEGAVPRAKLEEFRDSNIKLREQVEGLEAKFKDIDPIKYKEFAEFHANAKDKELLDKGKIDEIVGNRTAKMKEEHANEIKTRDEQLSVANRQLEGLLIDSAIRTAATASKVLPSAVDDVLLRARTVFQIKDGVAVPMEKGNIVYGKDADKPMSPSEWVGNLVKTAPHLFEGNRGGGAPARHGAPGGENLSSVGKIAAGLEGR